MSDTEYRLLKANEIQCRPQVVKSYGFSLLLYKDARCDMAILDKTYGRFNWQRKHSRDNRNCTIEIWDADKSQWVGKEDVGTESYTEKEKGLASDSFKRAGFNWGIGRELYTSPFIWIKPREGEIKKDGNKYKLSDKAYFYVDEIEYNENREVSVLVIKDKDDKIRFTHGTSGKKTVKEPVDKNNTPNQTPKKSSTKSNKDEPKQETHNTKSLDFIDEATDGHELFEFFYERVEDEGQGFIEKYKEPFVRKLETLNKKLSFIVKVNEANDLLMWWQEVLDNAEDENKLREEYYDKVFKKLQSLN